MTKHRVERRDALLFRQCRLQHIEATTKPHMLPQQRSGLWHWIGPRLAPCGLMLASIRALPPLDGGKNHPAKYHLLLETEPQHRGERQQDKRLAS